MKHGDSCQSDVLIRVQITKKYCSGEGGRGRMCSPLFWGYVCMHALCKTLINHSVYQYFILLENIISISSLFFYPGAVGSVHFKKGYSHVLCFPYTCGILHHSFKPLVGFFLLQDFFVHHATLFVIV